MIVGFPQNVAGAEVDFVSAEGAFDEEEFVGEGALGDDGETGEKWVVRRGYQPDII